MTALYLSLSIFLLLACIIISIPFWQKNKGGSMIHLTVLILFCCLATGLYQFNGNKTALHLWLAGGEAHYHLLETFASLGGVDGAIIQIKTRLARHPEDKAGWQLLGKLYLSKGDEKRAKEAFAKATHSPHYLTDIAAPANKKAEK